jgi:hypothetical protein
MHISYNHDIYEKVEDWPAWLGGNVGYTAISGSMLKFGSLLWEHLPLIGQSNLES